jgi:hypothetical protein
MNDADTTHGVGHEIGTDAAIRTEEHAAEYCARERQRIELTNQPGILALRGKIGVLKETADDIEARIPKAAPPGEVRSRRRKALLFWSLAAILCIAGFVFAVLAFEPFRLGWKAWLYCVGIAVVTPFLVDQVLESWPNPNFVKVVRTAACLAAILSGILLAVIRGDLFTVEMADDNPAVTVESDDPPTTSAGTTTTTGATSSPPAALPATPAPLAAGEDFYVRTLGLLRLAMALFAFTLELGSGLAVHEARRWSALGEDSETLQKKLTAVRSEMIELGYNLWLLENEGAVFENTFWRDFYRSLLVKTVTGAMRKLPIIILALVVLVHGHLHAADRLDVVVLPDLSQSVATKDQSDRAEFQKNIDAVTRLLASLPAGSRVSIYGITDDSFGKPYPLLTAELSGDEGYFKERIAQAHRQLVHAWQERSLKLKPQFSHTDILGAILIASQVFAECPNGRRKVLVLYSDMRQSTGALDLEHKSVVEPQVVDRALRQSLGPDLHGVEVYVLGVDGGGVSVRYWNDLRSFWLAYFQHLGGVVKDYSTLRPIPALEQ